MEDLSENEFDESEYSSQDSDNLKKLPEGLTSLTFGHNFNKSVDNLPSTITNLSFGRMFNKSVEFKRTMFF